MNKYYLKIMCVFLVAFVLIYTIPAHAMLPLQGKVIVVDAGHGGLDPGTLYHDIYEKDIVLNISKYLEKSLSEMGATVILTRDSDKDLSGDVKNHRKKTDFDNRIKIINNDYTDMYLSIHLNYLGDSRYSGAQVFYHDKSKRLAMVMQQRFNKDFGFDREIKNIPSSTYMYNKLDKVGVLVECGFLSNNKERELLVTKEYQKRIADVITKGVMDYYK